MNGYESVSLVHFIAAIKHLEISYYFIISSVIIFEVTHQSFHIELLYSHHQLPYSISHNQLYL